MTLKLDGWPRKTIGHLFICIISQLSVNSNWSYSPETPRSGQNRQLFVPRDLKIWQMALKTIGHLLYANSSYVHHFVTICEFKLELQPGYDQIGSISAIFVLCDLEIWRMTLKKNRAFFQACFKLCELFQSYRLIQTRVTDTFIQLIMIKNIVCKSDALIEREKLS